MAPPPSTSENNHEEPSMSGMNFPTKLYKFLSMVDELNISNIVSWQPHGRCFRIHDIKEFVKLTNPSWFIYSKYSSFQRQLNIYGFQRIVKGVDKNCYYHKHFLRGHPHLIPKIDRIPLKKDHQSQTMSSPTPDFYSMPPVTEDSHREQMDHKAASTLALNSDHRTNILRLMNLQGGSHVETPTLVDMNSQCFPPHVTGNAALLQSILQSRSNTAAMSNYNNDSPLTLLERLHYLKSLSGALPSYGDTTFVMRDNLSMFNLMPNNPPSSELTAVLASRIRAQQLLSLQLHRGLNAESTMERLHHYSEGGKQSQK